MEKIGIVVIGRNEGTHLERTLEAVKIENVPVVYVDSASEDQSVAIAQKFSVNIVLLGKSVPTTPARARNEGFAKLLEVDPAITLVQFIDGDCEIIPGWIEEANSAFKSHPEAAIVTGLLEEKNGSASMYKRLSVMEWKTTSGEIKTTGGNMMARADVFKTVNGFDPTVIAAEDDDFCIRVRSQGWKILRIDKKMAKHDSMVNTFRDFWKRAMRTGYAYAQVSWLHWDSSDKIFKKEIASTILFGGVIPILIIVFLSITKGYSLLLLLIYPLLFFRIYIKSSPKWGQKDAFLYSFGCVIGKFPEFFGACKFYANELLHKFHH